MLKLGEHLDALSRCPGSLYGLALGRNIYIHYGPYGAGERAVAPVLLDWFGRRNGKPFGVKPIQMQRNRLARGVDRFLNCAPAGETARQIRHGNAVIGSAIFMNDQRKNHRRFQGIPAWRKMLLSVPIGRSRVGCETVTSPCLVGWRNCLCAPRCRTSIQPSCSNIEMTSRLDMLEKYNRSRRPSYTEFSRVGVRASLAMFHHLHTMPDHSFRTRRSLGRR